MQWRLVKTFKIKFNTDKIMSSSNFITIKEAASMSGKSIQTIRRMIKSKKIKFRKDKTPQGFNYLIDLESFKKYFEAEKGLEIEANKAKQKESQQTNQQEQAVDATEEEARTAEAIAAKAREEAMKEAQEIAQAEEAQTTDLVEVAELDRSHQKIVQYEPVKEFNETMQKLIVQHGKEKENLFKLVESFQNKVISLENKLKVSETSKKKWFKLW